MESKEVLMYEKRKKTKGGETHTDAFKDQKSKFICFFIMLLNSVKFTLLNNECRVLPCLE